MHLLQTGKVSQVHNNCSVSNPWLKKNVYVKERLLFSSKTLFSGHSFLYQMLTTLVLPQTGGGKNKGSKL